MKIQNTTISKIIEKLSEINTSEDLYNFTLEPCGSESSGVMNWIKNIIKQTTDVDIKGKINTILDVFKVSTKLDFNDISNETLDRSKKIITELATLNTEQVKQVEKKFHEITGDYVVNDKTIAVLEELIMQVNPDRAKSNNSSMTQAVNQVVDSLMELSHDQIQQVKQSLITKTGENVTKESHVSRLREVIESVKAEPQLSDIELTTNDKAKRLNVVSDNMGIVPEHVEELSRTTTSAKQTKTKLADVASRVVSNIIKKSIDVMSSDDSEITVVRKHETSISDNTMEVPEHHDATSPAESVNMETQVDFDHSEHESQVEPIFSIQPVEDIEIVDNPDASYEQKTEDVGIAIDTNVESTQQKPINLESFFDKKSPVFNLLQEIRRENRWLDCDIMDISDKHGALACVTQSLEPGKFRIVINSGTYRFNNVKNNQLMLALHVAECVFRCVLEFTKTKYTLKKLDTLLDEFHDKFVGHFEED